MPPMPPRPPPRARMVRRSLLELDEELRMPLSERRRRGRRSLPMPRPPPRPPPAEGEDGEEVVV